MNAAGRNSVLVAIGANLSGQTDSPKEQVKAAIAALPESGIKLVSQSRLFGTPCFPPGSGPDFVNAAVLCRSALGPERILSALHDIEDRMGRVRHARWGARVIDLDLLAYGDTVAPDRATWTHWASLDLAAQAQEAPDRLILPHPRTQDRGFVLVPLMDIAPDWVHPVSGQSVRQMVAALAPAEVAAIRPLAD